MTYKRTENVEKEFLSWLGMSPLRVCPCCIPPQGPSGKVSVPGDLKTRGSIRAIRLAGLVVKASTSAAEDPGFESRLRRDFSGSSHTSDLKIGTPVAIPCLAL